jgi:RNA polymerase sigma factor (sigma-70 family)
LISKTTIPLSTIPEKELWVQFQNGNEVALSTLYSIYFEQLYNYGFRFSSNAVMVEDCIQEFFIKIIRNRNNLAVPDSVKSYIFKGFRFYMYDKIKQENKFQKTDIDETTGFELQLNKEVAIINNELATEQQQKLQSALQQLTPRQREAIFLKYEEAFSYPEIAEMLGLTQKATYKLIGRAIAALRTSLTIIVYLFIIINELYIKK